MRNAKRFLLSHLLLLAVAAATPAGATPSSHSYSHNHSLEPFGLYVDTGGRWPDWLPIEASAERPFGQALEGWGAGRPAWGDPAEREQLADDWAAHGGRESLLGELTGERRGEEEYLEFRRWYHDRDRDTDDDRHIHPVPELPTWALVSLGLAGIFLRKRLHLNR